VAAAGVLVAGALLGVVVAQPVKTVSVSAAQSEINFFMFFSYSLSHRVFATFIVIVASIS
jgi:hypothetical protein